MASRPESWGARWSPYLLLDCCLDARSPGSLTYRLVVVPVSSHGEIDQGSTKYEEEDELGMSRR